ncbi:MAG: hydrogenase nickel incorporation protein HypB [Bacteroidota bacterium]|nr:hydrogenase nickel incorporation protein HypB [Bacteroidota bacterium]
MNIAHEHGGHHHEHGHNHHHAHDEAHDHEHHHHHSDHAHTHSHANHDHSHGREIQLEIDILQKNNLLAERNRGFFEAKNILALNLVSSPGSGKTSLLERTIKEKKAQFDFNIIEGDQQTMNDANRIESAGAPVVQVNTGAGCHLDSDMVNKAVKKLSPKDNAVLVIENVGNLVCPSMFDLGETKRVVIVSTTEGEDKPVKYPNMFQSSHLCIINKTDLLPHLDFDLDKMIEYAKQVNPQLEFIQLSVKTGEGMDEWYDWLERSRK